MGRCRVTVVVGRVVAVALVEDHALQACASTAVLHEVMGEFRSLGGQINLLALLGRCVVRPSNRLCNRFLLEVFLLLHKLSVLEADMGAVRRLAAMNRDHLATCHKLTAITLVLLARLHDLKPVSFARSLMRVRVLGSVDR